MIIPPEISDEVSLRKLPILGRGMTATAYEYGSQCLLVPKNSVVPITSLNVMNGISSEHLIPLLGSYQTTLGKTVLILPKGELLMPKFSKANPTEKVSMIYQMMCGLYALHYSGFIHGDLKPANMLVVNEKVQLIDFEGCCRVTSSGKISHDIRKTVWQLVSSPYITAPELYNFTLRKDPVSISLASDIWSLGISIFELYEGVMPQQLLGITRVKDMFERHGDIVKAVISKITNIPIETIDSIGISAAKNLFHNSKEEIYSSMPAGIIEIVLSCLELNPLLRPNISDLLQREIFSSFEIPTVTCKPNNIFIENEIVSPMKLFPQEEIIFRCMAEFTSNLEALYVLASKMTFSRPNGCTRHPPSLATAKAIYSVLEYNNFWIY